MTNDWLPGRRAAQLELAKQWKPHVTAQKTAWSIPNAEVTRLGNAIELVDQCQADVERNPKIYGLSKPADFQRCCLIPQKNPHLHADFLTLYVIILIRTGVKTYK